MYTLKFGEKITFYHFSKKCLFSVFLHIEAQLSLKNAWLPQVFFLDSKSPWHDLLVSHSHYLGKKYFPLVGTVLNPPWSASSCLKWSLNTSYPCKRNIRVWQGKLTLGRTHKLIPPLIDMLQYLVCRFFLQWRAFDLLYKMRYFFSSRICITISHSPNPSRIYIRLCKHGKRFLLLKYYWGSAVWGWMTRMVAFWCHPFLQMGECPLYLSNGGIRVDKLL